MALILADSFDTYREGVVSDFWSVGPWTGSTGGFSVQSYGAAAAITRFGTGKSCRMDYTYGTGVYKNGITSSNTIYTSLAIYPVGTSDTVINLSQGGTNQMSVTFNGATGNMIFARNGTTVATFTGTGIGTGIWTHVQFKIVLSATVGECRVRINGSTTDSFVATGLNTLATGTASIDSWQILGYTAGTYVEDIVINDDTGTTFNTWLGDARCYILTPSAAGSSTNFATQNYTGVGGYTTNGGAGGYSANTAFFTKFVAGASGPLAKFSYLNPTASANNMIMAVYADSVSFPNAKPGVRLATSNSVSSPAAGAVDFTFASPPSLVAGTTYWAAINSSGAFQMYAQGGGQYIGSTYPNFADNPGTAGWDQFMFYYTITAPNWSVQNSFDGDTSVTSSATVNNVDLFTMNDLPTTPNSILGVIPRIAARKTDAGSRSFAPVIKSGATTNVGTATAMSSSYVYHTVLHTVDPNTSSAWTAAAVNALEAGYKITA